MIDLRRGCVASTVLVAVLAGLAACGAPGPPATAPSTLGSVTPPVGPSPTIGSPASSGATGSPTGSRIAVTGMVLSSPGCPGPARAESACPDRPVAGAPVELTRGTTVIANARTDSGGHFLMRVPSGTYRITAHNVGYASKASQSISVSGPVTVRLVVDSGLR